MIPSNKLPLVMVKKKLLVCLALLVVALGCTASWARHPKADASPTPEPTADPNINRALTSFYAKNFDDALTAFDQAVTADPKSTFSLVMWLETAHRLNKLSDAANTLEDRAQKSPNDAILQAQLALTYMYLSSEKMSAVTRGQEAFDKSLTLDPNCCLAHAALGLYYFTSEKTAKARNQLEKALEINPGDVMATERLGEITLIEDDKPELSIPKFKEVVTILPNYPDGWFFLGMAQEKSKKTKDAIASYERSITLDPFALTRSVYSRVRVARLYQDGKRKDLAIQVLQDLIKNRPDFKDAKTELTEIQNNISARPDDRPEDSNVILDTSGK